MTKTFAGREVIRMAEYDVERKMIYSNVGYMGRETLKKLTVYKASAPSEFNGRIYWYVQVGNGRLHPCSAAERHETIAEFHFGTSQRWAKA